MIRISQDELVNDVGGPIYFLISHSSRRMRGLPKQENNPFGSFFSSREQTFIPRGYPIRNFLPPITKETHRTVNIRFQTQKISTIEDTPRFLKISEQTS